MPTAKLLETLMAAYLLWCVSLALRPGPQRWTVPLLALFAAGFLYITVQNLACVRFTGYPFARRAIPHALSIGRP